MLRKPHLHAQVIQLRKNGFSYNEILNQVPIAKGTVSMWCRDILLTNRQKYRLVEKKRQTFLIQSKMHEAAALQHEAVTWAQSSLIDVTWNRQILFLSGILLYWAEGTKMLNKRSLVFTNTDPVIIKMMLSFFEKILEVPPSKIRVKVRLGNLGNIVEAENYWSKITGMSRERFQHPEIILLPMKSKSLKKYPHGICRISVYDSLCYRKMIALIAQFAEKFSGPRSSKD